ncbi:MAG: signal peptidase II [Brotaphodocola sp.]
MKDKIINLIIWAAATCVLVLADQYTKMLAVIHLKNQPALPIIDGVFELFYSENRGAAFGMMQGRQVFFLIIAVFVLSAAAYMMWKMPSWKQVRYHWLKICVIMITAGAIGNMIDRVSQGYVVDFLYFSLINFPIFNVADIYVTTATAILILLMLAYYKDEDLDIFRLHHKEEKGENL